MTRGKPAVVARDRVEALFARVRAAVLPEPPPGAFDVAVTPATGDHSLNEWTIPPEFLATARPAAVLVALLVRDGEVRVQLTQRTGGLRDHAGQIAFPGGKMDPGDASPAAAAIREAWEEIGLPPRTVEVLGYLDPYLTRTGFRIIPVIARITEPFDPVLNAAEVVETFEVPLAFLMNAANHRLSRREWMGTERFFYEIAHGGRRIWGVTAGILHILAERLAAT